MFQNILVPTDFDEHASRAFDVAVSLAQKFDGKITLLHVYQIPPSIYSSDLAWPTEQLAAAAKKSLADSLAKAKAIFPRIESVLEVGSPGETIVNVANKSHADLIVMATHGRRGLSRALLGSVTEKVVRLAHQPVLTVSIKHD
jgi:universal stress protein A